MKNFIYAGLAAMVGIGLALPAGAGTWIIDFDNNSSGPLAAGTVFGNLNGNNFQRYDSAAGDIPGSDGVGVNIKVYSASQNSGSYKINKAVGFDSSAGERGTLGNSHNVNPHDPDLDHSVAKHESVVAGGDQSVIDQHPDIADAVNNPFNNILIIQSSESSATRSCPNGNCPNADDEARGGDLTFTFDEDVRLFDMDIFDNEEKTDHHNNVIDGLVYFYDELGGVIDVLTIPTTEDGGVTLMTFNGDEGIVARRMMVWVPGSFALDNIRGNTNGPGTPQVPEPAAAALFGVGLVGLVAIRRRRKAAA